MIFSMFSFHKAVGMETGFKLGLIIHLSTITPIRPYLFHTGRFIYSC